MVSITVIFEWNEEVEATADPVHIAQAVKTGLKIGHRSIERRTYDSVIDCRKHFLSLILLENIPEKSPKTKLYFNRDPIF